MKFDIVNKTKLDMEIIGKLIDRVLLDAKEDTLYVGKKDSFIFKHLDPEKDIKLEIVYLKTKVKWIFTEVKA